MIIITNQFKSILIIATVCGMLFAPLVSQASAVKPSCSLTATTKNGEVRIKNSDRVAVVKGDDLTIAWQSKNAKKAYDSNGKKVQLAGSATSTPLKSNSYSYEFENGSRKTECSVKVVVVDGSFDSTSLISKTTKPTLKGKVTGSKTVQIEIYKENSKKVVFTSKLLKVKNGTWSTKITKSLPKGEYRVLLRAEKTLELNTVATSTLKIGDTKTVTADSSTTFVTELVPLLIGGTTKAGMSVPISYLQVINIGKTPGEMKSFTLKQNGSATVESLAGLSVSNEQGVITTVSNGGFKNNELTIPVSIVLAPGEMQLFTLKALLATNVSSNLGKQLKIDVASVLTNATMQSGFPIRGTTWTLGL